MIYLKSTVFNVYFSPCFYICYAVQVDDKETLLREKKQRQEEILRKEREKVDFLLLYCLLFSYRCFLFYILYSLAVICIQYSMLVV